MSNEVKCPMCGESVRKGLVRCWNCRSFMKTDIAEAYQEMQSAPTSVIYSNKPAESEQGESYSLEHANVSVDNTADLLANDDDFELAGGFSDPNTAETIPLATSTEDSSSKDSDKPEPEKDSTNEQDQEKADTSNDDSADSESTTGKNQDSENDQKSKSSEKSEAHSVATGGDVLLEAAMAEEKETSKRKRRRGNKSGFLVYCPNGHRIEVQERHRGMSGKCPKCKGVFQVPAAPPEPSAEEKQKQAEEEARREAENAAEPQVWMKDVHFHEIDPKKATLKANCLEKVFQPVDLCFSEEGILIVHLIKSGGFGSDKKRIAAREAMSVALEEGKEINECDVDSHFSIKEFEDLQVIHPVADRKDSLFAGIPIFGEWNIAVSLPFEKEDSNPRYFSFYLTDFVKFSELLNRYFKIEQFGEGLGFPLENKFTEKTCHYLDTKFQVLEDISYYENDPHCELELVGRQCSCCGLTISEDGRKKEKIGGKSGSGIAKAKCPKCDGKFGKLNLYSIQQEADAEESSEQEPESATEEQPTAEPSSSKTDAEDSTKE